MTDFVSRFQQRISDLSSSLSQEADLLLLRLAPASARRMRLCAIPHTFDVAVLQVLDPTLGPAEAEATIEEFQQLPSVTQLPDCLALHDVVRKQLFGQWLVPERRAEFSAASRRLADHFQELAADTQVAAANKQRSRLFHLIGADLAQGFKEFQHVYREQRAQARFNECEALVRLLREYEPAFGPRERAWLAYYEAEIADDNRDWTRAVERLEALLRQDLPDELRARALLRLASVLRRLRRFDEARRSGRESLALAERLKGSGAPLHLIHLELGNIARDEGNFDEARSELERAKELARRDGDRLDLVMTYNSLGTLLLRPSPPDAITAFKECMSLLDEKRDGLRFAQVLNNLALAHANLSEWPSSEAFYRQSIEIKRAAGDLHGLASTLLNAARVYQAQKEIVKARDALRESAILFERVHDLPHAAEAHRALARLTRDSNIVESNDHLRKAVELFQQTGNQAAVDAINREFRLGATRSKRRWPIRIAIGVAVVLVVLIVIIALVAD